MKKVITTLQSASTAILNEIELQYPNGVVEQDFTLYRTINGANFHALEVTLVDTTYLVKMNSIKFFNNYFAKDSISEDSPLEDNSEEFEINFAELEVDLNLDSTI